MQYESSSVAFQIVKKLRNSHYDSSSQVFDGTPAAKEGTLQSGDELLGVNGMSVKGKTKVAVAKMVCFRRKCLTTSTIQSTFSHF